MGVLRPVVSRLALTAPADTQKCIRQGSEYVELHCRRWDALISYKFRRTAPP